jgi:hypothetical protein
MPGRAGLGCHILAPAVSGPLQLKQETCLALGPLAVMGQKPGCPILSGSNISERNGVLLGSMYAYEEVQ